MNGREPDPLRRLSPDDAADGQARELHGCEHRHPAPSDPARQRKLGRYVQRGDCGNPGNAGEHAGDQGGCGLTSDGEQDERKCCPDCRPRHDPIGTQPRRCRQCKCAADGTDADRTEEYAVDLWAAPDSCAHEKRQQRPIDAREREEAGSPDQRRAQIRIIASVAQTAANSIDEALGG